MVVRAFSRIFTVLCLTAVSLVLLTTAAFASECPNELRREEQNSTYLPECRAYELVTPTEKNGSDVAGHGFITEASRDGERLEFGALAGFGDTEGSGLGGFQQFIASRNGGSWTSHGITPLPGTDAFQFLVGATWARGLSEDLGSSLIESYDLPEKTDDISHEVNAYRETNSSRALQTITTDPAGNPVSLFSLADALRAFSPDLSVVLFETSSDLTPEATGFAEKLYEWREGQLKLAGILPNGTVPAEGSGAVEGGLQLNEMGNQDLISRDGSTVLFLSPASGSKRQLYVRRNGTSTVRVSESEASSPIAEPEKVQPEGVSADGTKILFASRDALTDSDPGGAGEGLYLYTESPSPDTEANLTFIGRAQPSQSIWHQIVFGANSDLKRFYIETAAATATFAQPGIYLWDEGQLHTVAKAPGGSIVNYLESARGENAQASDDARQFAFISYYGLTADATGSGAHVYVYNEDTEKLRCVSCLNGRPATYPGATIEPTATHAGTGIYLSINPRFISADGRHVFFSSSEPLVAQDVNGLYDAYEYDTATEELSLLSSGVGQNGAWFAASGASGRDAFIVTRDSLLREDVDSLVDVYDVRVDGGVPQPAPQTGGCVGDECQGVPSAAPSFNTASGFTGLGNIPSAKHVVVKRKRLTRAQKRARALRACRRKSGKARKRCRAQARLRYAAGKPGKNPRRRAHR